MFSFLYDLYQDDKNKKQKLNQYIIIKDIPIQKRNFIPGLFYDKTIMKKNTYKCK